MGVEAPGLAFGYRGWAGSVQGELGDAPGAVAAGLCGDVCAGSVVALERKGEEWFVGEGSEPWEVHLGGPERRYVLFELDGEVVHVVFVEANGLFGAAGAELLLAVEPPVVDDVFHVRPVRVLDD